MKTLAALALTCCLALTACGADPGATASDPAPTAAPSAPSATPSSAPAAPPTSAPYPAFAASDYTYRLDVRCFCVGGAMDVTVAGGDVVSAVYVGGGRGVAAGQEVPEASRLSIDDVIDRLNEVAALPGGAARVEVDWPAGSDHPTSVALDPNERVADDEATYLISRVVVG